MEIWLGGKSCPYKTTQHGGNELSNILIGIDVSKNFCTAQGIDNDGHKQFYIEFSMCKDQTILGERAYSKNRR